MLSTVVSLLARTWRSVIVGGGGGQKWIKAMAMCCLHMLFAQAAFWLVLRVLYVFSLASFLMIVHKCVVVCSSGWEDQVLNWVFSSLIHFQFILQGLVQFTIYNFQIYRFSKQTTSWENPLEFFHHWRVKISSSHVIVLHT